MSDNFEKIDAMRDKLKLMSEASDRVLLLAVMYLDNNVDIDKFYNWKLRNCPLSSQLSRIVEYENVYRKMESLRQCVDVKVGERYVGTLSTN